MKHRILSTAALPLSESEKEMRGRGNEARGLSINQALESRIEYLQVGEADQLLKLWVNTVGWQKILPDMTYPPKEHPDGYFFNVTSGRVLDEYQLVYITEGSGKFYTELNHRGGENIESGYLLWLIPGQWHSYTPNIRTGWTEYYIGFKGELVRDLIRGSFLEENNGAFDIGFNEELVSLFMRALDVARNRETYYQSYLSGIVLHMLGFVLWQSRKRLVHSCQNEQKIERAKITMKEKLMTDLDFCQLAESLNLSYSYFRKLFKDYTGTGPMRYFQELKMSKAKQLLVTTDMQVKEILYALGYNTIENFYGAFKKHTGCTPIEYRRLMQRTDKKETDVSGS